MPPQMFSPLDTVTPDEKNREIVTVSIVIKKILLIFWKKKEFLKSPLLNEIRGESRFTSEEVLFFENGARNIPLYPQRDKEKMLEIIHSVTQPSKFINQLSFHRILNQLNPTHFERFHSSM